MLIFFLLLTGVSCQEKVDIEQEKDAILKVLNEETTAFAAFDMDRLSELHVRDELDTRLAGKKRYSGWSEIKALLEGYIENNKKNPNYNATNVKENITLKVTGNSAWVICDNIWTWKEEGETKFNKNIQISFLEKIEGDWKFSFNAFVAAPDQSNI